MADDGLIKEIKELESRVGDLYVRIKDQVGPGGPDGLWVATARVSLSRGFMELKRAVEKPADPFDPEWNRNAASSLRRAP